MKQKKTKIPFAVQFISWSFPKLEKVAPKTANKWALNLFFTPIRFPFPQREQELLTQADFFSLTYKGAHIQGYKWGNSDKRIFLAHGWASRGSQLYKFIPPLVEQGYEVITVDQLAHGKSEGKRTTIIDFMNIIKLVLDKFKYFEGIIAHSMGGVATLLALREEPTVKKFICIGTPSLSETTLNSFQQRLKASDKVVRHIRSYVQNRYQVKFNDFFVPAFFEDLHSFKMLIIHDQSDRDVSLENATTMHNLFPDSKLLITKNLGHTRILRDTEVIKEVVNFLK